jgi:hypothetical protein
MEVERNSMERRGVGLFNRDGVVREYATQSHGVAKPRTPDARGLPRRGREEPGQETARVPIQIRS